MPPYSAIHNEYLLYILLGGGLLTALLVLALYSGKWTIGSRRQDDPQQDDQVHEFGGGVREGHGPVPLFLVVMLVLFVIWAIGYTLFAGAHFPA